MTRFINSVQSQEERKAKYSILRKYGFSVHQSRAYRDFGIKAIIRIVSPLTCHSKKLIRSLEYLRKVRHKVFVSPQEKQMRWIQMMHKKNGECLVQDFARKFNMSALDHLKFKGDVFEPRAGFIMVRE